MIEPGRSLRLALEPGQVGGRGELPPQKHLHRDDSPQAPLPGPVDDPHPATADLLEKFVIAKQGRKRQRPRCHPVAGRLEMMERLGTAGAG